MDMLGQLFIIFFKVGAFTFGGGPAMLPVIRKEVVETNAWLTEEEFVDCLAVAQSLPGVLAVNTAIYIGGKKGALPGAVVAAVAVALPAVISIIVILLFLGRIEDNIFVQGAFEGVKAASTGLILAAAYRTAKNILIGRFEKLVAAASFLLIVLWGVSVVWAIVFSGAAGYLAYKVKKIKAKREGRQE